MAGRLLAPPEKDVAVDEGDVVVVLVEEERGRVGGEGTVGRSTTSVTDNGIVSF